MARTPITTPPPHSTTTPAVDVCSAERLDHPHHYVLVHTTVRAVNKALAIEAHDLDDLIALLTTARNVLHDKGIPTTPKQTPATTTPPDPTYLDTPPVPPAPQDSPSTCHYCGLRPPLCYCELPTPTT